MSEDNAPDVAGIAARLSEAQCRALLEGQCGAAPGNESCLCAFPENAALWELGLVERKGTAAIWRTALGKQVRNHLMEKNDVQG
ncbi:hypothetical protein ACFSTI_24890 [Rhizorhabdus histidinilytica]|uniref:Uncharacterized protein n=1 Tax=Rhizorhabdus histidinilytica TaxID=439228 RepID=A0A1T5A8R5_9SPHN|nr:hypothetical protein [Rhizorhabdus histidinilytica]SKB31384.1 hypothetical protein SAMN06295920_101717 [Rhizorhabdus histidinilytica]